MSRIPSIPYRVIVTVRAGERQWVESHNYTNLAGAIAYRDIALRKQFTRKVEVLCVLDESTPSHKE